ncbi:hypothetical protein OG785_35000 [Streptomyces sp. NBC_00006]|uniref:hypothetical protein n=1 Tax=Streptomyces sp. NBC_00006 TaxID=2975619 RepID=UPI00224F23E5|nr:hypothetical protein [Streptomyces sp. NBC_00006]MCX5535752.1 hypothetical protein [Streptomyces sp. NBC_00006]
MTSIAERAQAAAVYIRHHTALSPHGQYRGAEHARTAVRLAAALGLPLDQITTTGDHLRRRTTIGEPILATATCPESGDTYTFLARFPLYDEDAFELLGPCPECAAPVPLAEIRHLADLGTHLTRTLTREDCDRQNALPPTFDDDPAHTNTCRFGPCT